MKRIFLTLSLILLPSLGFAEDSPSSPSFPPLPDLPPLIADVNPPEPLPTPSLTPTVAVTAPHIEFPSFPPSENAAAPAPEMPVIAPEPKVEIAAPKKSNLEIPQLPKQEASPVMPMPPENTMPLLESFMNPPLPAGETSADKQEEPKQETATDEPAKPKKKKLASKPMPPKALFSYKTHLLPDTIYQKKYDKFNRHLPVAAYEDDYDQLMFLTAAKDNMNGLRAIMQTGRSVNMRNPYGETPLIVAVRSGAINTARLLLAKGADPNATDSRGYSAMSYASNYGYPMVEALREMGGD